MNNNNHPSTSAHRFSFHSANGMLPLVKSIARDVFQLHGEIEETKARLAALTTTRSQSSRQSSTSTVEESPYFKEVKAIAVTVEAKQTRMNDCVKELSDLNLAMPDVENPFVDFPAIYDGSDVCLCWKIGEPKIGFWHHPGEACDQRRPVNMDLVPAPKVEFSSSL